MKDKMIAWRKKLVAQYNRLWQYAKDYARKCRLVYKRMYSI
ncbi:hypothetical protein [Flagellimonas zhangzhouensis]|uniref:Uncharacterized protein n=1 Tax=Flagellimonas zhangzhouensis TaxID=1073328 RepID=A0A1H2XCG5_9FLAO|nr:hypothetical protein [Allomuricauda zhangzhouensis]SDQ30897.1 hypothetical protein SAMN05216294_1332 [Allomuricauda zhangzhouensis]SDW90593.1 hypothetical protein SAMN04487892_2711 [Allomuricauda zhangzhouensis]